MDLQRITEWAEFFQLDKAQIEEKIGSKRLPVLWISAQDCTGCVESFIRSSKILTSDLLNEVISLDLSELLSYIEPEEIDTSDKDYVVIVEGSIPMNSDFLFVAGKSVKEKIVKLAKDAKAVIAVGTCSSWGGIGAAHPNPTGAVPLDEILPDKDIIKIPGCPPISEAITGTLLHLWVTNETPPLDKKNRPTFFYGRTVHQDCPKKIYFDQKLFAESFDDENGYCLLKLGCKGPSTFNACESLKWNGIGGSPITAGNTCIGCSEKGSWDKIRPRKRT
ncbi:MAG: hydrogenase (NiFe) small subunit HydA [Bacillales bacterium]|jgi:hydrogenase small subunit|nr:hydrogenase (NiFe) small subunit HydA [Bacillales bacterium]